METCPMCNAKYKGNQCPCGYISGDCEEEPNHIIFESESDIINGMIEFNYMPIRNIERF